MKARSFLRYLATLAFGIGSVGCHQTDLVSIPHAASTAQPKPVIKRDLIPPAVLEVYMDLWAVQDFEHGRFAIYQRQQHHDSIDFNRDGRSIHFPTVRAYRANLQHRMDSLAVYGETFTDIDTSYEAHQQVHHSSGGPLPALLP